MWSKIDQIILWVSTYTPLILIMVFRFIINLDGIDLNGAIIKLIPIIPSESFFVTDLAFEIYFVILTILITVLVYKGAIDYLFAKYEKKFRSGNDGVSYSIRKIEKLKASDYSFFLLTLLLPIVSLDHSSFINLAVSLVVVICVITIYVKTDAISSSPLFFFSGRKVYKGIISSGTKEQELSKPELRQEAIIITKDINYDEYGLRGEALVPGVFYLTENIYKETEV